MSLLSQFLLRLAFGLAVGMAFTSSRQVSSGYFRNNLYVTLGLATLAALVLLQLFIPAASFAALTALLSFCGSTAWLYEAKRLGLFLICAVASLSLLAAWLALIPGYDVVTIGTSPTPVSIAKVNSLETLSMLCVATSGLVLGLTFAAMLLGHWYLNAPGMELAPLRKLIALAALAVSIRALVSGFGLAAELYNMPDASISWLLFVLLRWSFGIVGVLVLLWMAGETLKIPNTQSATGILYVAVIGVFVGELTSALLSAESAYPL